MSDTPAFIYIREHPAYGDACKLGRASNLSERDTTYATGEVIRGTFTLVIEVANIGVSQILEKYLQRYFKCKGYHIMRGGGTEFYNRAILNEIIPYLDTMRITYRVLTPDEINALKPKKRVMDIVRRFIERLRPKTPRANQEEIIIQAIDHYRTSDKGLLVLTCGYGKTLISLWIAQRLGLKKIVIGVPSLNLLIQWEPDIKSVFRTFPLLSVSGDTTCEEIVSFLEEHPACHIVLTTYASCYKLIEHEPFNIRICDEVHHLTTADKDAAEERRSFVKMLNIPADKQLGLTATLKSVEGLMTQTNISNDDENYFGSVIARKNITTAIQEGVICDYQIQTIVATGDDLNGIMGDTTGLTDDNKRLYLSCYCALRSIQAGHTHHLIIFANKQSNTITIVCMIMGLLPHFGIDPMTFYCSSYHSEQSSHYQQDILDRFKGAKYGILSCVYCLGEGYDLPLLNGVVFAENMTSTIRIVQSALRANRKNRDEPDKVATIILPLYDNGDLFTNDDNPDFRSVRNIIYEMGKEDENIEYKLKVYPLHTYVRPSVIEHSGLEVSQGLTDLLRMKTVHRIALGTSYEYARSIIAAHGGITSKEAYIALCDRDNRLHREPDIHYKSQFTSWTVYLGIPRDLYYDLETCKAKVRTSLATYPELRTHIMDIAKVCASLCTMDPRFPSNDMWCDFYGVSNLMDIIPHEPMKKKISQAIL